MASKADKLIERLEPRALENGLDLVTVEIAGTAKNPILRVYLDSADGGITLDELAAAQRWVDETIEEIDPFKCSYTLEVSSPGIDRPLRKLSDFARFEGEDVKIQVKSAEGKGKVAGVLRGVDGNDICVEQGEEIRRIAYEDIKRANIVGRIDFNAHNFKTLDEDADGKE